MKIFGIRAAQAPVAPSASATTYQQLTTRLVLMSFRAFLPSYFSFISLSLSLSLLNLTRCSIRCSYLQALAREISAKTTVLLKNDNNFLPFSASPSSAFNLLLLGPDATTGCYSGGSGSGSVKTNATICPLQAIQSVRFGRVFVLCTVPSVARELCLLICF